MENYSLADVAAATGNNGGFCGGNGEWLGMIFLFALVFGFGRNGFGYGGNGGGEPVTESGLCNAMNFNNLENAVGRLGNMQSLQFTQLTNGLANAGYENLRNFNSIQSSIDNCCCGINQNIDALRYEGALNTASINANTTAGIQKILDKMCEDRFAAQNNRIQSLELQLALSGVVRYPNGYTYNAGPSPFCGGCCNGNGVGIGNI